jgi:hypothetical protein
MMSRPNPSLDSFNSYEQWDPYDDISQQQTQTNDLKLCQFPDWDIEGPAMMIYQLLYITQSYGRLHGTIGQ